MIWPTSCLSIESWILVLGMLILISWYIYHKWQYFSKLNIPYNPPSLLKFGNMLEAFGQKAFFIDLINKKKFGLVYGTYVGLNPVLNVHDIEIMRQIYIKEFPNFTDRQKFLTKMMGKDMAHGLSIAKGDKWKRMRSTLSPTFSTSKLKKMASIMDSCTDQTVAVLQRKVETNDGVFIARIVFSNLSLDIISSVALGANTHSQSLDDEDTELAIQVKKSFKIGLRSIVLLIALAFPSVEWIFEKLGIAIFPSSALEFVRNFTQDIIKNKEDAHQKQSDLLQLMLDAEVPDKEMNKDTMKGITRQEVIGNAMLMIGAGFENATNAMTSFAYNLASHPDMQKRLQKEIDDTYKEKGGFTYETVNGMKYMEMCLNESLRLYGPILANSRVCKSEITINGLTIPEGIQVNFPTFALGHDTDYWDEPWEYNPERMADMSHVDPMVFQPFGAGPRNCIGLRFALTEIKMTFCKILHKFSLEPTQDTPKPPLKLAISIGIKPAVEFSLRAIPRNDVNQ